VSEFSPSPRIIRTRITARAEGDAPFDVEAAAFEEDTYTVLSATPEFRVPRESLEQAMAAAGASEPFALGAVVVRPGAPLRFLAVVHDLSLDPSWTEDSVSRAMVNVMKEADARALKAIAVPPLGTKYGTLDHRRCVELFIAAIAEANLHSVERVWFVVPESFSPAALDLL
jgi:O-acetyl-ADP-ribose deacetylase (regulator of RNase III)